MKEEEEMAEQSTPNALRFARQHGTNIYDLLLFRVVVQLFRAWLFVYLSLFFYKRTHDNHREIVCVGQNLKKNGWILSTPSNMGQSFEAFIQLAN